MKLKLVIAVVILVPVFLHLAYAIANSDFANYYITVDQLAARTNPTGQSVRVGGSVVAGSIQWDAANRSLRFQLAGSGRALPVVYRGFVPDAFRDNVTAIIEGALDSHGTFIATNLIVKCPHQYLPAF